MLLSRFRKTLNPSMGMEITLYLVQIPVFFWLSLPEYPEQEILKQKLLFAIENVTKKESDHVTNVVEVSEG